MVVTGMIVTVQDKLQGAFPCIQIQLYNLALTMAKRMLQRSLKDIKFHMTGAWKIFLILVGCSLVACDVFIIIVVILIGVYMNLYVS